MVEHYFSEKQKSDDSRFEIQIKLRNDSFAIMSASGIFSKAELDTATKLLIENSSIGEKILDLGCGYGVVGISILRRHKDANVYFSDVNERALDLTAENLKKLNLKGTVVKSNVFDNLNENFDTILTNPPMAAGRKVCYQIIEDSYKHLDKEGTLQLVARHNKGGKTLSEKMEEVFGNVEAIAISGGFRVYLSRK
jgi:16S rRNA (guanine1207-N2)-methyltransferase